MTSTMWAGTGLVKTGIFRGFIGTYWGPGLAGASGSGVWGPGAGAEATLLTLGPGLDLRTLPTPQPLAQVSGAKLSLKTFGICYLAILGSPAELDSIRQK